MSSEPETPATDSEELVAGYVPKLALTYAALVCFGGRAVVFSYRFLRTWSHKWMLCLTIGTITMAAGFGTRIPLTDEPTALSWYIATTMLTLLSPCAFLAHLYMLLPRLATYLEAPDCLYLRPRFFARIFVWLDVVIFLIQMGGASISSEDNKDLTKIGKYVVLGGLGLQCLSFSIFIILALIFVNKLKRVYPHKWADAGQTNWRTKWRIIYYALLYNCVLVMVRCAFRVAEFSQGDDGELRTNEWYLYVFDTLPLFLAIAAWAVFWPPRYLGNGRDDLYNTSGDEIGLTARSGLDRDPYSHRPGRK